MKVIIDKDIVDRYILFSKDYKTHKKLRSLHDRFAKHELFKITYQENIFNLFIITLAIIILSLSGIHDSQNRYYALSLIGYSVMVFNLTHSYISMYIASTFRKLVIDMSRLSPEETEIFIRECSITMSGIVIYKKPDRKEKR